MELESGRWRGFGDWELSCSATRSGFHVRAYVRWDEIQDRGQRWYNHKA